jgi:hypothetical protein
VRARVELGAALRAVGTMHGAVCRVLVDAVKGTGLILAVGKDGSVYVEKLVEGSAAASCGSVAVGDVLLEVDGEDPAGDIDAAEAALAGEAGVSVRLKLLRRPAGKEIEVALVRGGGLPPPTTGAGLERREAEAVDGARGLHAALAGLRMLVAQLEVAEGFHRARAGAALRSQALLEESLRRGEEAHRGALAAAHDALAECRARLEGARGEAEQARAAVEEKEGDIKGLQGQIRALETREALQRESHEAEVARLELAVGDSARQCREREDALRGLEEEKAALQQRAQGLEEEGRGLAEQVRLSQRHTRRHTRFSFKVLAKFEFWAAAGEMLHAVEMLSVCSRKKNCAFPWSIPAFPWSIPWSRNGAEMLHFLHFRGAEMLHAVEMLAVCIRLQFFLRGTSAG